MVKTDSTKATYVVAGRNNPKTLTTPEISIPSHCFEDSDMSMGFWRLK